MATEPDPHADDADDPPLDPRIQMQLGARLQSFYDTLLREPVPDKFIALLQKLDAQDQAEAEAATRPETRK